MGQSSSSTRRPSQHTEVQAVAEPVPSRCHACIRAGSKLPRTNGLPMEKTSRQRLHLQGRRIVLGLQREDTYAFGSSYRVGYSGVLHASTLHVRLIYNPSGRKHTTAQWSLPARSIKTSKRQTFSALSDQSISHGCM